jgi:phosphatidate cytidylyltransferase
VDSTSTSTAPARRAGRNLPVAVGVGLGLGAVVVLALFVRKEAFLVLAVVAVCLAAWELAGALATRHLHVPLVPLLVGCVVTPVATYAGGLEALLVSVALTAFGVLAWRLLEVPDLTARQQLHVEPALGAGAAALRDVTVGVLATAWLPLLAGFAALMLAEPDGAWRIFVFILLVVCSDIGGYAAGVLWGRHPMAPTVSPKKSWEGLAGSAVAGLAGGVAGVALLLDGPWWAGALVGAAAVAAATLGDLSESVLKRDLGVKDMGSLLPGHGGVMDRLDSLLPTAPVVWLLLALFVPAG